VGGRCVAGDKASHTAMRNMMACTVTGQGAGVAAAVSIQVADLGLKILLNFIDYNLEAGGGRLKVLHMASYALLPYVN
jgi:hypothetical protein